MDIEEQRSPRMTYPSKPLDMSEPKRLQNLRHEAEQLHRQMAQINERLREIAYQVEVCEKVLQQ